MKKVLILLLLVIPALVVVGAVLWSTGVFVKAQPVDLVQVTLAPLQRSIDTNGKVEADNITELRAPQAGICHRSDVVAGEALKKGREILRIEDPGLPSQHASAQAELDAAELELHDILRGPDPEELNQAQADVSRFEIEVADASRILKSNEWLLERDAISRFEVEQSRQTFAKAEQTLKAAQTRLQDLKAKYGDLDRKRAQSRVDAANSRLQFLQATKERLIVRAPADGTLYQFEVKNGAYLNTGDPIGLFADLTRLRVRAYVDEPDFGQIVTGEKVLIRWEAHPDAVWDGVVTRLPAQVVALGTRSVAEVLCSIDNPQGTLLPNINVDVEIRPAPGPPVKVLPRGVVFPEGNREFVWVIEGGKAAKHYIETGRSTNASIEITGALSPGDQVIDPGELFISEGMKVRTKSK